MKSKADLKNKINSLKSEIGNNTSIAKTQNSTNNLLSQLLHPQLLLNLTSSPAFGNLAYHGSKVAVQSLGKKYIKNKTVETIVIAVSTY